MRTQITAHINKVIILILLVTYPNIVFSQLDNWVNYTNGDMVTKILNDGEYLWIATDGGLVKFNKSTEEKTFYNRANAGLPDNHLRSLAKDNDGNLWVTTQYHGVGKWDGSKCQIYEASNSGLTNNQYCLSIAIDNDNNKWIGSLLNLNKFDGTNWQSWTTPNSAIENIWVIYSLKFDKNGVLWMGGESPSWSFAKFTGTEIQTFSEINSPVYNIEIDNDNNIWLATGRGLIKYDGENFVTYNTDNSNIPDNYIYDVKKDVSGNLWLACSNYLVKFDGTNFIKYETPLIDNIIYCLEFDNDDNIWLGTRNNGLIKYTNGTFKRINVSNSPLITNDIAFDLSIDADNNVWFGTKNNLVKIDKNNNWYSYYEKIDYNSGERRACVTGVDLSGNLWAALGQSDTCVVKIEDNNVVAFTKQNSPLIKGNYEVMTDFKFDKKGNTWIASRTGLYKYDGTGWVRFTPANSPLKSYSIGDLAIDKDDNLWGAAGDEDGGCLFKYDGTSWLIYTTENSPLPTNFVVELAFDSKNNLWVHCRDKGNVIGREYGGGLTKFDGSIWTTYNIKNSGIPSNSILDIAVDKEDNLWLATYGHEGVTKYDGANWQSYNVDNSGIAFDEVSKITIDYYRDQIWFNHLMSGGLSVAKLNSTGVGIGNNPSDNNGEAFDIYPNPASTKIFLHFKDNSGLKTIEIFDLSGKLISSHKFGDTTSGTDYSVTLSDLNIHQNGLYLIRIISSTGVYSKSLLVAK